MIHEEIIAEKKIKVYRSYNIPIAIISIAIPIVVTALIYLKPPAIKVGFNINIIPAFNAAINFTVSLLLLLGYYFMMTKRITYHKYTMNNGVLFVVIVPGVLCCLSFVGGRNSFRRSRMDSPGLFFHPYHAHYSCSNYRPHDSITMTRGLQSRFDKHRRIAKWTWPLWLYVSVTGVIVYLLLSPYYQ